MPSDDLTLLWTENTAALRARIITANLTAAPRSHITLEFIFELAVNAVGILFLGSFAADHIADLQLAVPAGALMAFLIAYTGERIRELTIIRSLEAGAPLLQTQERLARVALARTRLIAAVLALGPLMWTIALFLLAHLFFGQDAAETFGLRYVIANFVVALAVLVAGIALSRRFLVASAPGTVTRRLCDVLSGASLARARRDLETIIDYAKNDES